MSETIILQIELSGASTEARKKLKAQMKGKLPKRSGLGSARIVHHGGAAGSGVVMADLPEGLQQQLRAWVDGELAAKSA